MKHPLLKLEPLLYLLAALGSVLAVVAVVRI
jgi:hypothetical protein